MYLLIESSSYQKKIDSVTVLLTSYIKLHILSIKRKYFLLLSVNVLDNQNVKITTLTFSYGIIHIRRMIIRHFYGGAYKGQCSFN